MQVNDRIFLQTHTPFDPGVVAITDTNAEAIFEVHKQSIVDQLIIATFMKKPEDTTNEKIRDLMLVATDLYEQNLALEERIAALEGAGA
ncbi:hypothetical protein [uncultured Brevibacillus sp.]|uniref:hypothetical protein n=1 Tax=uncultured Brevibacillus sp. TaxID=169970 RepID=UPI0025992498|nr:hypothetical protein [uncultured Brevibacillus sp.]